jgi:hypothetical protein
MALDRRNWALVETTGVMEIGTVVTEPVTVALDGPEQVRSPALLSRVDSTGTPSLNSTREPQANEPSEVGALPEAGVVVSNTAFDAPVAPGARVKAVDTPTMLTVTSVGVVWVRVGTVLSRPVRDTV